MAPLAGSRSCRIYYLPILPDQASSPATAGSDFLAPAVTGPRMIKPPSQAPFAPLLYSIALPRPLPRPSSFGLLRRLHRASLHSMFARLTLWVHLRWLQLDHPMVSFQRLGSHLLHRPSTFVYRVSPMRLRRPLSLQRMNGPGFPLPRILEGDFGGGLVLDEMLILPPTPDPVSEVMGQRGQEDLKIAVDGLRC